MMIHARVGGGAEGKSDGEVTPHEISCAHAVFAPIVTTSFNGPLKYAPEENFDLCSDLPKGFAKGYILVTERGVCPMLAKVEVASQAGAIGVVMVQSDDGQPSRMISYKLDRKGTARVVKIPAVMISKADADHLEHLRALASTSTGTGTGTNTGTNTGISVTLMSSFADTDPIGEEARSWDQIRSAKGSAAKAAVRLCTAEHHQRSKSRHDSPANHPTLIRTAPHPTSPTRTPPHS